MKKESEPALLQRFLNADVSAGGNTEVAARRSKWIASGTEVLQAATFVVSKLDSQKDATKISEIMAKGHAFATKQVGGESSDTEKAKKRCGI